ncbi:putative transcription factor interactor and regulator CCHC(Zn) family [Arabidopsis thaliana]
MALNNPRRTRRYLALGLADEPIAVPETVYAQVREKKRQSLVCRVLSPRRQDLYSVIDKLRLEWCLGGYECHGRIIGGGKCQFVFEKERDLEMKWEDEQGPEFLKSVPMWLKIRGIPIQYLCDGTVREIASSMGEVMEVELDDGMVDLSSVRARVNVCVDTRLCFKKVARFDSGEVKIVSFRYEDIGMSKARFKFCFNCGDMNHLARNCLIPWVDVPDPYERSLSPPPHESNSDGSAEGNCGDGGTSSGTLELLELVDAVQDFPVGDGEQLELAGVVQDLPVGDGEQQQQGLDGVEEANATQVDSEMVGISSEGSKRKFDAVEQGDENPEKRLRGITDATEGGSTDATQGGSTDATEEGLGVSLKPLQGE